MVFVPLAPSIFAFSCSYLFFFFFCAQQVQKKVGIKRRPALTAESDGCTAAHRAKTSTGRASCGSLFGILFIAGTINQWSACVKTEMYNSLFGCHNSAALPDAHWSRLKRSDREGKSWSSRRVVALAEAPTGPGSGTVRLCCPPSLTFSLLNLQTCPGRNYFPLQGRTDIGPQAPPL